MMGKNLLFVTSPAFLDVSIETIKNLSTDFTISVIIYIAPESLQSNIVSIKNIPPQGGFFPYESILDKDLSDNLSEYFERCKSVRCYVIRSKRSTSFNSLFSSLNLGYSIFKQKSVVFFEDTSLRLIGVVPFLLFLPKIILGVHDPKPHSGEKNWRNRISKSAFFPFVDRFILYSGYSCDLFKEIYPSYSNKTFRFKLPTFSFYRSCIPKKNLEREYITFIGRISPYKGIDVFLKAIPIILKSSSDQKFLIAGKLIENYAFDTSKVLANSIVCDFGYLDNKKMTEYILKSKCLVLPYLDATQSGIIMTAYALGTPVIVSNVGGLPEYISVGRTGYIFNNGDERDLAEKIILLLTTIDNHADDFISPSVSPDLVKMINNL